MESTDRNITKLTEECNSYLTALAEKCNALLSDKEDEYTKLCNLATLIITAVRNSETDLIAEISNSIKSLLRDSERIYLSEKELSCFARKEDSLRIFKESYANMDYDIYGRTDIFPAELEKIKDGYRFILPSLESIKISQRFSSEGKNAYYITQKLLHDFEKNHGEITPVKEPVAIFFHHISEKNKYICTIDADNIDAKQVVDAMQGYMISDDNLLNLWTIHMAKTDKNSYCELYILERNEFEKWFSDHSKKL